MRQIEHDGTGVRVVARDGSQYRGDAAVVTLPPTLHFFAADAARDLVARYAAALAPGSYVVLSVGRGDSDAADQGFGAYSAGAVRVYNHSVPEFASFFGPLDLVPPGMVDAREWRPDWEQAVHLPPRDGQVIVGVARAG